MVRQIETKQQESFIIRALKNLAGIRPKEQQPDKVDKSGRLLQEVCDEEFLKQSEKLRAKRKRMLFLMGEFNPPDRLMAQYYRYEIRESSAAFGRSWSSELSKEYGKAAYEAATRRPYGLIDHLRNQSESRYFAEQAQRKREEAEEDSQKITKYYGLIQNIKQEIDLFKAEIERLNKLIDTETDISHGLKLEQVVKYLKEQLSPIDFTESDKRIKEMRERREKTQLTVEQELELIAQVKSKKELEELYNSAAFSGIQSARSLLRRSLIKKDELEFYEALIKRGEENLTAVSARLQEMQEKQANGPINFQEYRQLRDLAEKKPRMIGRLGTDRCICEIIKLERKYK